MVLFWLYCCSSIIYNIFIYVCILFISRILHSWPPKHQKNIVYVLKMTLEIWNPKNYTKIAKVKKYILIQWNRWVVTNIHLYQSFPLTNKWSPLHQVPWEIFLNINVGELFSLLKKFSFLACCRMS
jgi:hypothetical protein